MDSYYNQINFPLICVRGHQGGNFDLFSNREKTNVASIPVAGRGCTASRHGDWHYARQTARLQGSEWLGGDK